MSLLTLPNEILFEIIDKLNTTSVGKLIQVNRELYKLYRTKYKVLQPNDVKELIEQVKDLISYHILNIMSNYVLDFLDIGEMSCVLFNINENNLIAFGNPMLGSSLQNILQKIGFHRLTVNTASAPLNSLSGYQIFQLYILFVYFRENISVKSYFEKLYDHFNTCLTEFILNKNYSFEDNFIKYPYVYKKTKDGAIIPKHLVPIRPNLNFNHANYFRTVEEGKLFFTYLLDKHREQLVELVQ